MITVRDITVTGIDNVERRARSVAIGNFDGVHLGHRDVVRGCDTVLTFAPHPVRILRPDSATTLLTSRHQKIMKLAALGVREVVTIPFDAHWAAQPAATFVDDILVGILDARHISVGFNFRYRGDIRSATRLLGAPFTQPATIRDDHTVVFPSGLAVPSAGTYLCDLGGVVGRLSFDGHPHLVDRVDPPGSKERETTVTFLCDTDSDVAPMVSPTLRQPGFP
jgi:hypothetical protein